MKTPMPAVSEIASPPGAAPLVYVKNGDDCFAVTIESAAAYFDCDVKRLRGWIHRDKWGDPIGSLADGVVYPLSLQRFLQRRQPATV